MMQREMRLHRMEELGLFVLAGGTTRYVDDACEILSRLSRAAAIQQVLSGLLWR